MKKLSDKKDLPTLYTRFGRHSLPTLFSVFGDRTKQSLEEVISETIHSETHDSIDTNALRDSLHPAVAEKFAAEDRDANKELKTPGYKHLLKISVNKGEYAGTYVESHSYRTKEREFLHTHEKILDIHPEPEIHHASKTVIWHATKS